MHNPPHPGEILSELWLTPMGPSITEAARRLKVSRKTLSEIVNGRAAVSAEMAFDKSAASWLGHQPAYDLWQMRKRRAALGVSRVEAA